MARGDAEPRDRADRGQRFAAEPERADLQEILVVELGGGVAIDREREIGRGHAAAIVGDADPPPSAAVGEDIDPAGAGVDGVLDQFLDHAGGPLDHFAGGDAVDDLFGKLADGHGCGRLVRLACQSRRFCRIRGGRAIGTGSKPTGFPGLSPLFGRETAVFPARSMVRLQVQLDR